MLQIDSIARFVDGLPAFPPSSNKLFADVCFVKGNWKASIQPMLDGCGKAP